MEHDRRHSEEEVVHPQFDEWGRDLVHVAGFYPRPNEDPWKVQKLALWARRAGPYTRRG